MVPTKKATAKRVIKKAPAKKPAAKRAAKQPATRRPSRDEIESELDKYLKEQKCILYGIHRDIIDAKGRAAVVEWLAQVFEDLNERMS